jgi:hypothetical protein
MVCDTRNLVSRVNEVGRVVKRGATPSTSAPTDARPVGGERRNELIPACCQSIRLWRTRALIHLS